LAQIEFQPDVLRLLPVDSWDMRMLFAETFKKIDCGRGSRNEQAVRRSWESGEGPGQRAGECARTLHVFTGPDLRVRGSSACGGYIRRGARGSRGGLVRDDVIQMYMYVVLPLPAQNG
jgi:hypothetical protein